jgi:hypothetical protein
VNQRKRGRPKGTGKPFDYWSGLLHLVELKEGRPFDPFTMKPRHLLALCQRLVNAGLEWRDPRRGWVPINNARSLRTRLVEAWNRSSRQIKPTSTKSVGSAIGPNFNPKIISAKVEQRATIRSQRETVFRVGRKLHR